MKQVFKSIGLVLISGLFTSCQKEIVRPNIIYIMSDDHTTQAFGIYGSRLACLNPTPVLDSLARRGIIFDHAFCTNAICTPSRTSIMTGQYSQTNGVLDLDGNLPPEKQYLAHEMKKLGYHTAMIGKWHLKQAPEAFDYYNVLPGQGDYFDPVLYSRDGAEKMEIRFGKDIVREVNASRYKGHSTDVITDIALNWLKNGRDKSKPFFLKCHFKAPHDFFEFAPRYKDYLENTEIPEPASLWYNAKNGSVATRGINNSLLDTIGSSVGHRNVIRNMGMHMGIDPAIPDPEYKHLAYQEYLKRYLRCVKGVDDNLKRILDYIRENDLMENTVIIYTGDQGFMLGEHDYIDKRWMYEESMKMPLLIHYPKMIKVGTRTDAIVNNTDFAPTMIELAGGKVPAYMQGNSFKEILETGSEPDKWQQATYYRYWMHMAHNHNNPAHFGIRTKDYKLIFFYGVDYKNRSGEAQEWANNPASMSNFQTPAAWEFYDLKNDPFETNNRYDDPACKKVIDSLKVELQSLREKLNEGDDNYPQIQKIIKANWSE
ncbi:MAG: sulfatase [Bacteroidales bacterium]